MAAYVECEGGAPMRRRSGAALAPEVAAGRSVVCVLRDGLYRALDGGDLRELLVEQFVAVLNVELRAARAAARQPARRRAPAPTPGGSI